MRWKIKSRYFLSVHSFNKTWSLSVNYQGFNKEEWEAPPRTVGSQVITVPFWGMTDVYLRPSGWAVELLPECRNCRVIQWSSSGICVGWFGLRGGLVSLLWEQHARPRCARHSPMGPSGELGRGKAGLWMTAGLGVTLVCSPAWAVTCAGAKVRRERYCWKQRC